MATYATADHALLYIEGLVIDNADAFERLLERAERDIDRLLGPRARRTTGLKLDPARLNAWEVEALARATCAQAEYRLLVLEAELGAIGAGGRVEGPDFAYDVPTDATGAQRRIGPNVANELEPINHLRRLTARTR